MSLRLQLFWVCVCIAARLLPHPANVTPFFSLMIIAAWSWPQYRMLFLILIANLAADIGLAYFQQLPVWGSWTWATYSGFGLVYLLNRLLAQYHPRCSTVFIYASLLSSSLFYWLWTNVDVWLFSGLYRLSLAGLLNCYWQALPFLRNSVLGDLVWFSVLFWIPATLRSSSFGWQATRSELELGVSPEASAQGGRQVE